ncbi:MAG: acyl-CoA/acyl-ACP dehydrogenase [Deltaproteobacteria bacterium]|nr:acyl-CoA/acyl-ACP dehydrogenase [Deltaproteobacteria bacterium]
MNLDFTSEQNMLRDAAAKFFAKECPFDRVKELEESDDGYAHELWRKMAELGWQGLIFPEAYGGFEAGFMDLIILCEEMGKAVFPSPFFSTVIQCGLIILEGGSEEQKKELLPRIAEGELIMALAQLEEDAGYLESSIAMPAVAQGENYVLNGTKMFVTDANVSEKLIVAARPDGEGPTLFLLDTEDPGIRVTKMPAIGKDNVCEVIFENVSIPKSDIIGAIGGGFDILQSIESKGAVTKAAEMVGGARSCIDITAAYAKEREQYGLPIGGFQIIQHYMANMLIKYDVSSNYLYQVAWMVDEGMDFETEASALKASVNENFKFISERAVQIHGGIGTTREANIALFYRKAKSYEYACGDTEYHYQKVMDNLLK